MWWWSYARLVELPPSPSEESLRRILLELKRKLQGRKAVNLYPCDSVKISLLWRDSMTTATLLKENISLGLAYSFKGSVHCHHGRKHGSIQAGTVLEELRLDPQAARDCVPQWAKLDHVWSQSPPPQWHTSSNKDTPTPARLLSMDIHADKSLAAIPIKSSVRENNGEKEERNPQFELNQHVQQWKSGMW